MIRRWIGSIVVRAYPRQSRRERGLEMVDTLLDASEHSSLPFLSGCVSLVTAGLNERGRYGARLALAGVAVTACGAGAAIALTTGGGSPTLTGQTTRVPVAWRGIRQRVFAQVSSHGGPCRISVVNPRLGPRQLLEGAPPTELSSLLAVLRQPAPTDARVSALRLRQLDIDAQGIYIRYARNGVTDGITYYMIPAANVGEDPMPARCYAGVTFLLRRCDAGVGTGLRLPCKCVRGCSWSCCQ